MNLFTREQESTGDTRFMQDGDGDQTKDGCGSHGWNLVDTRSTTASGFVEA